MLTATLTEQWPKQWAERGFLPVVDVLAPDEAIRCRAQFDALEREIPPAAAEVRILDRHFDVEFVWRLATHPRVLDAVEAVLGPDVVLLASNFFCKYPAEERGERFVGVAPGRDLLGPRAGARHHRVDRDRRRRCGERMHERDPGLSPPGHSRTRQVRP